LIKYLAFILGDIEVWDAKRQPGGDNPCRRNNGIWARRNLVIAAHVPQV